MGAQIVYHKSLKLMGNLFQLSAMGDDEDQANNVLMRASQKSGVLKNFLQLLMRKVKLH